MYKLLAAFGVVFSLSGASFAGIIEGGFSFTLDSISSRSDYICNDDLSVSSDFGACGNTGTVVFTVTEGSPATLEIVMHFTDASKAYGDFANEILTDWANRDTEGYTLDSDYSYSLAFPVITLSLWESIVDSENGDGVYLDFSSLGYLTYDGYEANGQAFAINFTPNWQTSYLRISELPAPPVIAFLLFGLVLPFTRRGRK